MQRLAARNFASFKNTGFRSYSFTSSLCKPVNSTSNIGALSFIALSAVAGAAFASNFMKKDEVKFNNYAFCENSKLVSTGNSKRHLENILIISGNSNKPLAESIANHLEVKLGDILLKRFADGEVSLQILDSVRGKDIYLIQPTSPPVNEHLMELLFMISTCRRASAKKITAVIPYYGYARQDRKLSSRVPISAADVAKLLETMGVDRVVAVDLHCGQIQGFFGPRVPVDNLEAQVIGLEYFMNKQLEKPTIVSPDAGGVYRARKFQEGLIARGVEDVSIAMLIKQRSGANQIDRMDLVGSVSGSDVIIVDDMIDTAGTLVEAARELRRHGAKRIYAFATHGLFNGSAVERIENSPFEEIVVTNSISLHDKAAKCSRITQLSIGELLAEAIDRIHNKGSLNAIFHLEKPKSTKGN